MKIRLNAQAIPFLCLLCLITTLNTGCSQAKIHKVTEEQNGSRIPLKIGDLVQIELAGNITTGYTWEIAENNPDLLQPQGEVEYQAEKTNKVGRGGTFIFSFKAIAKGNTILKLIYRRPFEKDVSPIRSFQLSILVE